MNHMKEVAEMLGVELGEEFKIRGIPSHKYKLLKDGLWVLKGDVDIFDWINAPTALSILLQGNVEIEWQPKEGERYYYPSYLFEDGYSEGDAFPTEMRERIQKNVGIYKTPGQAQQKARELGWLE